MDSEVSWILLCLMICCVAVTTLSLESHGYYDDYKYDQLLYQRSQTSQDEVRKNIDIAMPDVHPTKHDSYFCTSAKMSPDTYIVGYSPHAEMHTAHHMLLFGCDMLPSKKTFWNCGDMGTGVCGGNSEKIMYAWGRNAPVLKLPKDVAFQVGDKNTKYLVLQVHYGHVDKFKKNAGLTDRSGVVLSTTNKKPHLLASIKLLAAGESEIPPGREVFNLDLGCKYENPAVIHPFAFRVHAHSLGKVITGYRVRDGEWKLIGKGDPQRPQAFYDIPEKMDIREGDLLAARCTYDSTSRKRTTSIGATMKDEMCNFYLMFYFDPETTNSSPENSCGIAPTRLAYPADSIVPLPDNGEKMVMKRDEDPCPHCLRHQKNSLEAEDNWPMGGPSTGQLPNSVGQITGVSLDTNGDVVIFHRSSRSWNVDTFDNSEELLPKYRTPIPENTITWLDAKTGLVKKQWGAGMFYLPHGLTVDKDDNLWLTDVGSHQVFKISKDFKHLFTLGEKLKPGKDSQHFCKPTGVALDKDGSFFVSDGYCNERVLKFSPKGKLLLVISNEFLSQGPRPRHFSIPHSVSTDQVNHKVYVADRENGRVLVFDSKTGRFQNALTGFGKRVFAAHYSPLNGGLLHVVNGGEFDSIASKIKGFTYSLQTNTIQEWQTPIGGFEMPHDVASDGAGHVYVAEIKHPGGRIWKFV